MKKYLKESTFAIVIAFVSLIWIIKPDVLNYFHRKDIEEQNKKNYVEALTYYNEFYKIIKNHNLDKPFSDIESKEMYHNLLSGCYYMITNDIKDDKTLADLSCVSLVENIYRRLILFNSELKRKEILQALDILKSRINQSLPR